MAYTPLPISLTYTLSAPFPSHRVRASRLARTLPDDDHLSANGDAGVNCAPPRGFIGQITRTTNIPCFPSPAPPPCHPVYRARRIFCFPVCRNNSPSSSFFASCRGRTQALCTRREREKERDDSRHGVNRVYLFPLGKSMTILRGVALVAAVPRSSRIRESFVIPSTTSFNMPRNQNASSTDLGSERFLLCLQTLTTGNLTLHMK